MEGAALAKLFLVNEIFENKFSFKHTGLSLKDDKAKNKTKKQLEAFYLSLVKYGYKGKKKPKNWIIAFQMLEDLLTTKQKDEKIVIFIDELPWLDTARSNFITALEFFWNNYACSNNKILFIVCGSATSCICHNLINNHGGLYNRLTYFIKLEPFKLSEIKEYLLDDNIQFAELDIANTYMILGGVPFYYGFLRKDRSFSQNIDNLFFGENAKLKNEFANLFSSTFVNHGLVINIIKFLFTKNIAYTREEIVEGLCLTNNGKLSEILKALEESNFILKYMPFNKNKENYYKLIDPFCQFYLNFVENKNNGENFWTLNYQNAKINSWQGYAFENLCFNHIKEIKKALGIEMIQSNVSTFFLKENDKVIQIDMLIRRKDKIVNVCEIKFYNNPFKIDNEYYLKTLEKNNFIQKLLKKNETIINVLISTYGLYKKNTQVFILMLLHSMIFSKRLFLFC